MTPKERKNALKRTHAEGNARDDHHHYKDDVGLTIMSEICKSARNKGTRAAIGCIFSMAFVVLVRVKSIHMHSML